MRTNTQEAVLSAYIASIGKRTSRDAAQDAAELCRLASSLSHLNKIACNCGLTERQEQRKQNLHHPFSQRSQGFHNEDTMRAIASSKVDLPSR